MSTKIDIINLRDDVARLEMRDRMRLEYDVEQERIDANRDQIIQLLLQELRSSTIDKEKMRILGLMLENVGSPETVKALKRAGGLYLL